MQDVNYEILLQELLAAGGFEAGEGLSLYVRELQREENSDFWTE